MLQFSTKIFIKDVSQVTVWPDWVEFHHFGNILKALVNFVMGYLVFHKNLNQLWQFFYSNGPIFIVVIVQKWTNNIAIWSHCSGTSIHARYSNVKKSVSKEIVKGGHVKTFWVGQRSKWYLPKTGINLPVAWIQICIAIFWWAFIAL